MKNQILAGILVLLAISLFCCNQQKENLDRPNIEQANDEKTSLLQEYDDSESEEFIEIEVNDSDSDAYSKVKEYCVFKITEITSSTEDCPFEVDKVYCFDCPGEFPDNECPDTKRFRHRKNGEIVCEGKWESKNDFDLCRDCPEDGIKGYRIRN